MIGECYSTCASCVLPANQLACTSCKVGLMYLLSCQVNNIDTSSFIYALAIIMVVLIIVLFAVMLLLGVGFLRESYENLQLVMLISWGFGMQDSATPLVWLNLGDIDSGVNFAALVQFFVVMAAMVAFASVGRALEGRTNTAFSLMYRRKKVIFPFRLYTFFYNFFLISTLTQILFLSKDVKAGASNFVVAFLCLIYLVAGLGFIVYQLNFSKAQLDDPRYYALVEKQISTKWTSRNHITVSLVTRLIVIASFVGSFGTPLTAEIVMLTAQSIYCVYFAAFVRYAKWRWWAINFTSNVLLLAELVCSCQFIRYSNTLLSKFLWLGILLLFCVGMIAVEVLELAACWMQVKRQLRSVYVRFIRLEKEEQELSLNKYDSNYNKEKVTEFVENPLRSNVRPLQVENDLF